MAEEKKKYVNKRRINGEFCQVHLQLPIEFNKILDDLSKQANMTKAAWVTYILKQVVANDGKVSNGTSELETKRIEDKLDTIINMVAKL